MNVTGRTVRTFAEATHAFGIEIPTNADYPFLVALIVAKGEGTITVEGRGGVVETAAIKVDSTGRDQEYVEIAQSSSFQRLYQLPPKTFRFMPFREE